MKEGRTVSATPTWLAAAKKDLARLDQTVEDGKNAAKEARVLRDFIARYEKQNSNGKRKRRSRLVWVHRPANCILPVQYHEKGKSRKLVNNGLCKIHADHLRQGTLTEEENEEYDEALTYHRERGNLK